MKRTLDKPLSDDEIDRRSSRKSSRSWRSDEISRVMSVARSRSDSIDTGFKTGAHIELKSHRQKTKLDRRLADLSKELIRSDGFCH